MSNSTGAVQDAPSTPADPAVIEALETFVSAPNMFEAMFRYLDNPNTPTAVRRLIGGILDTADKLATSRLAVA